MSNFSYLSTRPEYSLFANCCHRGRESVLHLPGNVRGGMPEGVGAGGEVGVCGR